MASEKAASLGGVGALESLLAPVVAAGAVGNSNLGTPVAIEDDIPLAPTIAVATAPALAASIAATSAATTPIIPSTPLASLHLGTTPRASVEESSGVGLMLKTTAVPGFETLDVRGASGVASALPLSLATTKRNSAATATATASPVTPLDPSSSVLNGLPRTVITAAAAASSLLDPIGTNGVVASPTLMIPSTSSGSAASVAAGSAAGAGIASEVYGVVPAGSLGVHSLKPEFELPVRGILDFMTPKDPLHSTITTQISSWPVRKSGFLFRRDLQHLKPSHNTSNYSSLFPSVRPTASTLSNLSTSSNSSAKTFGRSIMALLHSRSKHSIGGEYGGPPGMHQPQRSQGGSSITGGGGVVMDARSPSITSTLSYPGMSGAGREGGSAEDEEDWGLYYVEVRGRYMFFYLVMPVMGQQQQQPGAMEQREMGSPQQQHQQQMQQQQQQQVGEKEGRRLSSSSGSGSGGKRPNSQMSFGSLKEAVKPQIAFNKMFDNFSKRTKAAAQHLYNQNMKRPSSVDLRLSRVTNSSPIPPVLSSSGSQGGPAYQAPNNSGERRNSGDSSRSFLWSSLSPNDIKNAPRTLIHYIPLHLASLEYVFTRTMNSQLFQTFSEVTAPPSSFPSYLSLSVRVGVPSPLDSNPSGMEERLMLDIVDELTWDWATILQQQQQHQQQQNQQQQQQQNSPSDGLGGGSAPAGTAASGGAQQQQLPTPTDSVHSSSSSTTSSIHSVIGMKPTPGSKKRELDDWVHSVRVASLLSFDPNVSTYGVWEQAQLQAMTRAASTVTAKASSSSILSSGTVVAGGGGGTLGGGGSGNGFIHRSLTRLSFGMGGGGEKEKGEKSGTRSSPVLASGTMNLGEGGGGSGGGWFGKKERRESMAQHGYPGEDSSIYGSSPGAEGFLQQQQQLQSSSGKSAYKMFKARKITNDEGVGGGGGAGGERVGGGSSINSGSSLLSVVVTDLKGSKLEIGTSSPKRAGSGLGSAEGLGSTPSLNSRNGLRGATAYKPIEPSPLSPPHMGTSISAFSWRDRGRSDPPVYDPNAVFPPETPSSPTGIAAGVPFPDTSELNLGRKRAMSHSVTKTASVSPAYGSAAENAAANAEAASEVRKFFPFFHKKELSASSSSLVLGSGSAAGKDASAGSGAGKGVSGGDAAKGKTGGSATLAADSTGSADANGKRGGGAGKKGSAAATPSRPSMLAFGFNATNHISLLMKRTATTTSNSSSIRRVPTKQGRNEKRLSTGTFVSGNGTYRSGFEWTGDVPLVLRKCVKLIEEIGLEVEGLYRVSGRAETIQNLERLFESDPTRVHLHPPPDSQILSSLTSPFLSEVPVSKRRQDARLSLTETISSSRSSIDAETLAALAAGPMSKIIELGNASNRPDRWRNTATSGNATATILGRNSPSVRQPATEPPRGRKGARVKDTVIASSAFSSGSLYDNDVHVVTSVVKSFLRKGLPPKMEPVTTCDLYEAFMTAASITDWRDRMISVQDIVHQLPTENFETLRFICQHLHKVTSFSASNKMTVKNLAIVFTPNIFKPPPHLDSTQRLLSDMPHRVAVFEILVEYAEWVFGKIEYENENEKAEESAPPPSDRVSMISEDESFAPLRKYHREGGGKSSRDIFSPSFLRRFSDGDAEKDSVDDVLDLIPREDTSSRIRQSFGDDSSQDYRDFRSDMGDDEEEQEFDDDDDNFESFDVRLPDLNLNRASSSSHDSLSSVSQSPFGSLPNSEGGVLQIVDGPSDTLGGSVRRSVEVTASRLNDEKRQRRRGGHVISAVIGDSIGLKSTPSVVGTSSVGESVEHSAQHPQSSAVIGVVVGNSDSDLKFGTSSQFGSSPGSPTSSLYGTGSLRSSVSRGRQRGPLVAAASTNVVE
ncbi:hypothetical protein HDU98_007325 [Podochytrium sp. JEL0797]|nr:hypothetical protein HDU98_007325 [Podochytrium sp. JEL0797]